MKTLWCKNQENPSDRISHAWAPLREAIFSIQYEACTACVSCKVHSSHGYCTVQYKPPLVTVDVEPVWLGVGAVDADLRRVKVQLSYMPLQINLFVRRFRKI